jgi:hypothetical protein
MGPGCSHPRITAATASDLDAVHRTNRDALIPGRGFATGWQETQDQRNGTDSQGTDRGDRRFRIIEGLQMPAQPRWRM